MSELLTNGDWRERLRQAIADKKTSMRAVSIEAGLGEGAVHSWLGKDQKDPSITHLLSVCRVLGITLVWLTKGYNITPATGIAIFILFSGYVLDMSALEDILSP